ncbi:MAG: Two-component system sensor histidine kinase, partial [uncultured Thermomicrobiales bacterium]
GIHHGHHRHPRPEPETGAPGPRSLRAARPGAPGQPRARRRRPAAPPAPLQGAGRQRRDRGWRRRLRHLDHHSHRPSQPRPEPRPARARLRPGRGRPQRLGQSGRPAGRLPSPDQSGTRRGRRPPGRPERARRANPPPRSPDRPPCRDLQRLSGRAGARPRRVALACLSGHPGPGRRTQTDRPRTARRHRPGPLRPAPPPDRAQGFADPGTARHRHRAGRDDGRSPGRRAPPGLGVAPAGAGRSRIAGRPRRPRPALLRAARDPGRLPSPWPPGAPPGRGGAGPLPGRPRSPDQRRQARQRPPRLARPRPRRRRRHDLRPRRRRRVRSRRPPRPRAERPRAWPVRDGGAGLVDRRRLHHLADAPPRDRDLRLHPARRRPSPRHRNRPM